MCLPDVSDHVANKKKWKIVNLEFAPLQVTQKYVCFDDDDKQIMNIDSCIINAI